jgi:hypothetical protein
MSIIAGAIFPLTGIPDSLPKAIPQQMGGVPLPHSGPLIPPGMPQNMLQALKAMSPAEKQQFAGQWVMRQNIMVCFYISDFTPEGCELIGGCLLLVQRQQLQQAQAAQLAAQQGPGMLNFNPNMQPPTGNQPNMNFAVNMMAAGGPPQGNFMMNRNSQTQGGHPGNMAAGQLGGAMPMNLGAPSGGNMNYEALQAMMQRNSGGGMGLGQNLGQKTL